MELCMHSQTVWPELQLQETLYPFSKWEHLVDLG